MLYNSIIIRQNSPGDFPTLERGKMLLNTTTMKLNIIVCGIIQEKKEFHKYRIESKTLNNSTKKHLNNTFDRIFFINVYDRKTKKKIETIKGKDYEF